MSASSAASPRGAASTPMRLRRALAEGRYAARIEEQIAWSRAVGISSVPTFVINDTFAVVGAQDYDAFRDIAGRITSGELKAEG